MVKLEFAKWQFGEKLDVNTKKLLILSNRLLHKNIDVIGFPEMALTDDTERKFLRVEDMNDNVNNALSEIKKTCKEVNIVAIVGHPYKKGEELYNRTSVLPEGKTYTYDKKYPTEVELKYLRQVK